MFLFKKYYGLSKYFLREGILFWIMIASLIVYRIRSKNRRAVLIYMPLIALWGTIMISTPMNHSLRYVFSLVYALVPVDIGLMTIREKEMLRSEQKIDERKANKKNSD